jgi:RNA polymerase sigma-70 factor (ECF subfamily)
MAESEGSATRVSLLGRVRQDPNDQAAWGEFVESYGPKIYAWCRRWHAQEADAEDVTQMVLLKLADKLRDFRYDPARSFRAWLKTLTHHAWYDLQQARQRPGQGSGDSEVWKLLDNVEARDDLVKDLEAECERQLLAAALPRVQQRVAPSTWEAFRLTALEGLAGAEAGRRLGMPASQVFVYKFRVQKLLEEEMARLGAIEASPGLEKVGEEG